MGLTTEDDLDEAVQSAVSMIELERRTDSDDRKKLAAAIQSDGLKINKMAESINSMDSKLCAINHEAEIQMEKFRINAAIEDEFVMLIDLIENCGHDKLPAILSNAQLNNLCLLYSSKINCDAIKDKFKSVSSCQIMAKYKSDGKITVSMALKLPVVSNNMQVAHISSIPIFHDSSSWQLKISGSQYIIYDDYSAEITKECRQLDAIVLCEPDINYEAALNLCITGIMWNSTISNCAFEKIIGPNNCYHKYIPGAGILISHSTTINVSRRSTKDDSGRRRLRHQKQLEPGMTLIENSNDSVISGYCDEFYFETGNLNFLKNISLCDKQYHVITKTN